MNTNLCECSKIPSVWSTVDAFEALQTPILGLGLETAVPEPDPDIPLISKSRYQELCRRYSRRIVNYFDSDNVNPMNLLTAYWITGSSFT